MTNLVSFDSSVSEFVVDSLQIAEATGKPHHVILKIIRKLCSLLGGMNTEDKLILSSYTDPTNRTLPKYMLTQKGVILLMSRMQDQLPWLIKLSNTFDKLQKELSKQLNAGRKGLRLQGQNEIDGREKIETPFGTSFKNNVPNEKRTIIPYSNIAQDHDEELPEGRVPVQGLKPNFLCDLLVEQSQRTTDGKIQANENYKRWQVSLHLAFEANVELPKPSYFGIKSKYDFCF